MSAAYETLTVALAAHCTDGTQSVGTGVPVAPGVVLTAHHVVCPEGAKDSPVRVRFWHATEPEYRPDPARGFSGFLNAIPVDGDADTRRGVIWCNPDLDAALVAVSQPLSIGHALIGEREPYDKASWKSEAFPNAAWENGAPEPVRIYGLSHSRFPNTHRFQIDAAISMKEDAGGPAPKVEGWAGASGAPLHIGGQLLGILLARKPNGEAKILDGLPITDCLRDTAFCAAIGRETRDAAPYAAALLSHLTTTPPLLKSRLALGLGLDATASDDVLRDGVLALQIPAGIALLITLAENANTQDIATIRAIALAFSAHHCAPTPTPDLRRAIFEHSSDFDVCPVGSMTGAEFLMAAIESRLPAFRARRADSRAPPVGLYALPALPENGCSVADGALALDVEARIGADLLHTENWLDGDMDGVVNFAANTPKKQLVRRGVLQDELAYRAREDDPAPAYYLTEEDPGPECAAERAALLARVNAIRAHFPQIGAVYIQPELTRQERRQLRPIQDILPLESG